MEIFCWLHLVCNRKISRGNWGIYRSAQSVIVSNGSKWTVQIHSKLFEPMFCGTIIYYPPLFTDNDEASQCLNTSQILGATDKMKVSCLFLFAL